MSVGPSASYLRNRGVDLQQLSFIREHPAAPYYQDGQLVGHYPAMVNALRNVEGQVITYHVTYLTEDGWKADLDVPKKILPPVETITGSAIRLCNQQQRWRSPRGSRPPSA